VLVGIVVGVGLYLLSRRTVTVTNSARNQTGRARVEDGVSIKGGRAPVCHEVAPGRYECDSGFTVGEEVVITTSDGKTLKGKVVEVQPQPSPVPPEGAWVGGVPEVREVPVREVG